MTSLKPVAKFYNPYLATKLCIKQLDIWFTNLPQVYLNKSIFLFLSEQFHIYNLEVQNRQRLRGGTCELSGKLSWKCLRRQERRKNRKVTIANENMERESP